ncbi:MAG: hypothetical protein J7M25_04145 [Deltaproteobacteria bacterium]|nr:hypothetical protein [Deltaproteobacteria bacterium]
MIQNWMSVRRTVVVLLFVIALPGCMDQGDDPSLEQLSRPHWSAYPGTNTVDGIDVSYWQGIINWDQVAGDGIVYAFIRVSDGDPSNANGVADSQFDENWSHARAAGLIVGAYQFFRPNQDVIAQANFLLSKLGGAVTSGDLPPVIDVEVNGGLSDSQVVSAIQQWIDRVEGQLGVQPIVYTSASLWSQYTDNSAAFADYPLWVAHYTSPSGPFWVPDAWSNWEFWQYSSSGSVAGISGNVDMDFFNGDRTALVAFTVGDPVCGDGYCTGDEDHASCPQDCPVCENIPAAGRIVDDSDLCFEAGGDPRWWRHVQDAGWDNTLLWTHTVATADQMDNYGVWQTNFDQAGRYRVEAYMDAAYAQSKQARYQVRHVGTEEMVVLDQTGTDGWAVVGEFDFAAGGDQWIRLEDYSGEPLSDNIQIVFDAVRLTRLDLPQQDGGVDGDGGSDGGIEPLDAGDATGSDGGADQDGQVRPPKTGGGCSCNTGHGAGAPWIGLWLLALIGLSWRHKRRG